MNKYKIIWEVSKEAFIEAESEEEAREIFYTGEGLQHEREKEITADPEIYQYNGKY